MSLNQFELPDFLVRELYKDTLLPSPVPAKEAPAFTRPAPRNPITTPGSMASPTVPKSANPTPPQATTLPPGPATPQSLPHSIPPQAPTPPQTAAPQQTAAPYKFLGDNRRKITLLVHSPGNAFLPDDQLAFLTKILEACRMTLADVAIVNQAAAPVTVAALRQQLAPAIMLLFGMEPVAIRLPINFPLFKIQHYDQCTYLSAPALDQLVLSSEESKLLKSKLWVCLKTLFDV